MNGRAPNKEEEVWLNRTKQIGCSPCIIAGRTKPFEVDGAYTANHHIDGQRKPGAHLLSFGCCAADHQHGAYSIHGNKKAFIDIYGTEVEVLEFTKKLVEELF